MSEKTPIIDKQAKRKDICKAYYERNKDKIKNNSLKYYYDNKEKYQQRYQENKDQLKLYNSEYAKTHREKLNETQRKYRERVKAKKASQLSP